MASCAPCSGYQNERVRGERKPKGTSSRARRRAAFTAIVAILASAAAAPAYAEPATWTLVGTGAQADSGDGGHAREAAINQPRAVATLPNGGYVWAEPYANRVRMVSSQGVVTTLAGTGEAGFGGDGGKATAAKLNFVHTAVPTADGGFLLADTLNHRIRKITADGIIVTVAGTGVHGFAGDGGPATSAKLQSPRSVAVLPDGGFLIADSNNDRIRRVSSNGTITTVAGTGVPGFGGDGDVATDARLSAPFAVAPTGDGGFLIADINNQRIRKVSVDGMIRTVAGNGLAGFSGDGGPATSASLNQPHNVVALPDGGFVIADTTNERVRRVDANGVITTLIGDGIRGDSGDGGPASAARVSAPKAMAVTERGDLLIADEQNNRIRFVGTIVAPTNVSRPVIGGEAELGRQLMTTSGVWHGTGPQLSYQWQRCDVVCENIPGAVAKLYTPIAADKGSALRVAVTASNPAGIQTTVSLRTATVAASIGGAGPSPSVPPTTGPPTPPGTKPPTGPRPGTQTWLVRATTDYQRAHEYTVRTRNTRLSDAIRAYGKPTCRATGPGRVAATWVARGLRVDGVSIRSLPRGKTGCSFPNLVRVVEIRLTDVRWMTSIGLRVGDTVTKLRRLYPRSLYVRPRPGSRRSEYVLVWRHERCTASCTSQAKRRGVNVPRLTALVENGKVIAFRLPVAAQRR
jgi:hypothetical protein